MGSNPTSTANRRNWNAVLASFHRRRQFLAVCTLVLGVVACGGNAVGNALQPMDGSTEVGPDDPSRVGEIWDMGVSLQARVRVRLDRVEVLGLPKGLTFAAVAYRAEDTGGIVGLLNGDLAAEQPDKYGHPVPLKQAVLPAGSEDWYVLVKFTPTAPGDYRTTGVRVWYVVNGHRQHQDYAARFSTKTA